MSSKIYLTGYNEAGILTTDVGYSGYVGGESTKGTDVIARSWAGRTKKKRTDVYLAYVRATGVEAHLTTPGNCGSWVLRRLGGDEAEFLVISFWESIESIRRFAGPDAEKARYFPEDDVYLVEKTPSVTHYDVAHASAVA